MIGWRGQRWPLVVVVLGAALLLTGGIPVAADQLPADSLRAMNVVPPGQSGFIDGPTFASVTGGLSSSYGAHFDDQQPLYDSWQYKAMQFDRSGAGAHPNGRSDVTIYRDNWGVPEIYADNEEAMAYGLGYAMAQDRLFQMDVFRRRGHGTLAALVGQSQLATDIEVRKVSEGSAARMAEFNNASQQIKDRGNAFAGGVNQSLHEQCPGGLPAGLNCPAEFALLGNGLQPTIANWTVDDTLAFGEYAGRFFGEFGHSEISAAKTYVDMVTKLGSQPAAELAFNDLYPRQDTTSPHTVPDASGLFPRHTGPNLAAAVGSDFANHDPGLWGGASTIQQLAQRVSVQGQAVSAANHAIGITGFGSNSFVASGSRTQDGNPVLYSGPQTGLAAPGFFWEVEMHDPVRNQRGVTVPAIPLIVIGRNATSGWSVTSAIDGNSDNFVDTLGNGDTTYARPDGNHSVGKTTETVTCNTPPSSLLSLLQGQVNTCSAPSTAINIYKVDLGLGTGHGLADPVNHELFVRESSVDNHLVDSLDAWDRAGLQSDASGFGQALSGLYLGFNFMYADTKGEIAYYHTGRYPIRPGNADPNLPMPGSGAYDWQGFEAWPDLPHAINPAQGYMVNWNNKPAKLWWSKSSDTTLGAENATTFWGPGDHVSTLDRVVGGALGVTFDGAGQLPRAAAYEDSRAAYLKPYLVAALSGSGDPTLQQAAALLTGWDNQRTGAGGTLGAGPTFFDRWIEHLARDVTTEAMSAANFNRIADQNAQNHWASTENQDAVAHKYELSVLQLVLAALQGRTQRDWLMPLGGSQAAILQAAQEAKTELGNNVSTWHEPTERAAYTSQGAGSVPDSVPMPNRGSYGQVIEPFAVSAPGRPNQNPGTLPNTSATSLFALGTPLGVVLAAVLIAVRRLRKPIRQNQGRSRSDCRISCGPWP